MRMEPRIVEGAGMDLAIESRALTVRYRGGAGIFEVDLSVERGEVFGFLGPNGAGKTTAIRTLLDLRRPDGGEVRVLGEDVRAGGGELRRRVGYLPGDFAPFGTLTGERTLELFTGLTRRPPVRREEVLDRLGFPRHALPRKVKSYSTGMRQMIGITLAFQHDPELLILDEPTSGLDPLVRDAFLALVRDARTRGQTVFLSSHVLDEVERCADRIGIIHKGRLHDVARVADLKLTGRRHVTLRWRDGRVESFESAEPPGALVAGVASRADGELLDVEIRPLGLDEIFRRIVSESPR
jgi:ABC-2 type transport system ATP-binding protein